MPEDRNAFLSLLDHLDIPFQVVGNAIQGRWRAAGRNLLDMQGQQVDALLPGNVIEDTAADADKTSGSEMLGVDREASPISAFAADFGLGTALNPLSYLSFGAGGAAASGAKVAGTAAKAAGGGLRVGIPFTKVGKTFLEGGAELNPLAYIGGALKGAKQVLPEGAQQTLDKAGMTVRRMFGKERVAPEWDVARRGARVAGANVGQAGRAEVDRIFAGLKPEDDEIVADIVDGFRWENGKLAGELPGASALERVASHPGVTPENVDRIRKAVEDVTAFSGRQLDQDIAAGVLTPGAKVTDADLLNQQMGGPAAKGFRRDYLQRRYGGMSEEDVLREAVGDVPQQAGNPSALKELKLETADDVARYLEANPQRTYDRSAMRRLLKRVEEDERMVGQAQVGKALFEAAKSGGVKLSDDLLRTLDQPIAAGDGAVVTRGGGNLDEMLGMPSAPGSSGVKASPLDEMLGAAPEAPPMMPLNQQSGKSAVGPSYGKQVAGGFDRARAERFLSSKEFSLADPQAKQIARGVIDAIAEQDPETARALIDAFEGIGKQGAIMEGLSKVNRFFKPYAYAGFILPRLSALTRNRISAIAQAASEDSARAGVGGLSKRFFSDMIGAIDDGIAKLTGKRLTGSELTKDLAQVEDAFKASGGVAERALAGIQDPILRAAVEKGVLQSFGDAEKLVGGFAATGAKKKAMTLLDVPMEMQQGLEHRVRYGLFKDMVKHGQEQGKQLQQAIDDAAKAVRESQFDYNVWTPENRAFRTLIPFGQWASQALPQQIKLVASKPGVGVAAGQVYGANSEDPLYPWLEESGAVPIGRTENGQLQVLSKLGLPIEALNMLPDATGIGRDLERTLVASSNPIIKGSYRAVSGRDPFFGMPANYDVIPGVGPSGSAGRAYQDITSFGLNPINSVLQQAEQVRKADGILDPLLNLATGASVVNVDPAKAEKLQLARQLQADPNVTMVPMARGDDPATKELMKKYRKAQRQQAAADVL